MSSVGIKRRITERGNEELPWVADLVSHHEVSKALQVKNDTETQTFKSVPSKKTKLDRKAFAGTEHAVQIVSPAFRPRDETKLPLSYIGMIAQAINSTPEKKLILADIYRYMERRFYHYLSGKPRWKNTVRHNLSFHKCFVKCECSRKGNRSHFWSIHPDFVDQFNRGNFSKTLDPPPFPRYDLNPNSWPGSGLCGADMPPPPPFSVAPSVFAYETLGQYESMYPARPSSFLQVISPHNSYSASSSLAPQPASLHSSRQYSPRAASLQFYPEPLPKPYQCPRQFLSVPWQLQPLHGPSSSTSFPQEFRGGVYPTRLVPASLASQSSTLFNT